MVGFEGREINKLRGLDKGKERKGGREGKRDEAGWGGEKVVGVRHRWRSIGGLVRVMGKFRGLRRMEVRENKG